jgi:Skp family chaperone for outer membrane proteins
VKKTALVLAGMAFLSVAIYSGTTVFAQGTTPTTPATGGATTTTPKTRIAVINLTYVLKNYKKFSSYQEDLKKTVEPYQNQDTQYKATAEKLAKEAQSPTCAQTRRDAIEVELKDLQRKVEDNKQAAQKVLMKKQEEQIKTVYMDVKNVVDRYAGAYGYELVLSYNDALTPEEVHSPQNLARKMQSGSLMPMFVAQGMDISAHVVTTLNQGLGGTQPAQSGTR